MTTFYRFPINQNFQSEFILDGVSISVIGDYYEPPLDGSSEDLTIYVGYLVNASKPIDQWAEFEVWPQHPMRIFA